MLYNTKLKIYFQQTFAVSNNFDLILPEINSELRFQTPWTVSFYLIPSRILFTGIFIAFVGQNTEC